MKTRAHFILPLVLLAADVPFLTGPAAAAVTSSAVRATLAAPDSLVAGTVASSWVMANGLRVMAHDIPGSRAVAVTVGYGIGADNDPAGLEGMASLLAEVLFTAPAGDIPARTRESMSSIRPLGWSLKVSPRAILLSEIATVEQFPGVLREAAFRMRGVHVTDEVLRAASTEVRRTLYERYAEHPELVLHYGVRLAATRDGLPAMQRYSQAVGVDKLKLADVQKRLDSLCTATHAVLSVTGDLGAFDIRRLIENTFADLPAGTPILMPSAAPLRSAAVMVATNQLETPAAVIGILAPALGDTAYPSFTLHALAIGAACQAQWPKPVPPFWTRFQYQLIDEPDLVRLFPPVSMATTLEALSEDLDLALRNLGTEGVKGDHFDDARAGMMWLLGSPLAAEERRQARTDPRFLSTLSVVNATRAMVAPESFWAEFRERLAAVQPDVDRWRAYFRSPSNQVTVLAGPSAASR